MHGYLSLDIICSSKLTVFLELRSRKTVRFSEQIMSADKYPCIFSRQMETIVYILEEQSVIFDDYRYNFFCTIHNCDYKIASKAIANRVKTVLPKLISEDQTGFIKGRNIGENICIIDSIINYTAKKKYSRASSLPRFQKSFWHIRMVLHNQNLPIFWLWTITIKLDQTFLLQYRKLYLEQWMDKQLLST